MGIPIERAIVFRRELEIALNLLEDRGWNLSVFSPGSSVNGKTLNTWMVMLSQPEEKWEVVERGQREDLTRMEAYKKALAYHGLEVFTEAA